uniref:Uncharacterized protein n=1 Tax=Aegilops tauschii subsp. strangulata TaxID=200361 RepID=A0A453LBJ2_AEGTS
MNLVVAQVPKEVALHLIGPSKVKKAAIKKIINRAVAEYVEKVTTTIHGLPTVDVNWLAIYLCCNGMLQENLDASKNLKVLQSYEELEATFEPGKEFCFDTAVHLTGS